MDPFLPYSKRAMVWLALAVALPLAAARGQTFLTVPVNLSSTGHGVMPSIAVGPGGEIDAVWLDSTAILFRRSLDGGMTFSPTMRVAATNLPSQASQPQIAVNSTGVYVAWAGTNSGGQGDDIFFSSLLGNASSFSVPVNVSNGNGIASGSSAPVPHVATDPSGGVDIVWGQNAAWFWRSRDGVSVRLAPSPMARVSPRLAINSQGHIFVVWENADPNFPATNCPTITFARSVDGGGSFKNYAVADDLTVSGQHVTGCTSDVQIAVGSSNTVHLLWANENTQIRDVIVTYATDDDNSFGSNLNFPENPNTNFFNISGTSSYTPEMAIDGSGNIDVVWMGDVSSSNPNRLVYFSRSQNTTAQPAGQTFSNPLPLSNQPGANSLAPGFPQISAESSGAIDVIWQQASAANPNSAYDIVLARSTDGINFARTTLNNAPTTQGGTGQIAADTSGNVYAAWQGNTGSGSDILLNGDSAGLLTPAPFSLSGVKVSVAPLSAVINVNGSASFNLAVSSTNSVPGSMTFTCGGAPAGVSCSFNPNPLSISANGTATAALNVSISVKPSASGALRSPGAVFGGWPNGLPVMAARAWVIAFVMLLATWMVARGASSRFAQLARGAAFALLLTIAATGMLSCGGSTNSGGGGGGGSITFPLTVQVQSNSATANMQPISITVP
jgi:hypothetical protein